MIRRGVAAFVALCLICGGAMAGTTQKILSWDALDGWRGDDHHAALSVFLETCGDLDGEIWDSICEFARTDPAPRQFFELFFLPVLIEDGRDPLFTGYYEPELRGARQRGGAYQYALYRQPPEATGGGRWLSRAEIETSGVLNGRGLEIVWLRDPVERFFLQIQGSGRVRLDDGTALRVGYGGKNGHEYQSVGKELVRRGLFEPHQVSAQVIQRWVRQNPTEGKALLHHNPSYVFFRELSRLPAEKGPLGAMNRSITTLRSIAVDPDYVPLGSPVWIEKQGRDPIHRLMIAQDTGSAIKGAQRADIFFGTGDKAGEMAGRIRDPGRLVVLMPIELALSSSETAEE